MQIPQRFFRNTTCCLVSYFHTISTPNKKKKMFKKRNVLTFVTTPKRKQLTRLSSSLHTWQHTRFRAAHWHKQDVNDKADIHLLFKLKLPRGAFEWSVFLLSRAHALRGTSTWGGVTGSGPWKISTSRHKQEGLVLLNSKHVNRGWSFARREAQSCVCISGICKMNFGWLAAIFVCLQGISREYRAVWMIHSSRVCLAPYVIVWYIYPINLL